jgi:hypothetical protein
MVKKYTKLIKQNIFRRISNVTHRIEAATRRSIGTPTHVSDDSIGEPEVDSFCLSVSSLQHLMSSERVLMIGIVPYQYQKKIFEIITRESVDAVVREGISPFVAQIEFCKLNKRSINEDDKTRLLLVTKTTAS